MKYNFIELKTDEDVKEMWKSFGRRITKRSIKLDVRLSKFVDDVIEMLKRPYSSNSV